MARPIALTERDETRFWSKVDRSRDCWGWTASVQPTGHGLFGLGGRAGGMVLAHRVAWTLANGPIPEGMNVCHSCDNPPCVNPAHLWLGTQADNLADMRRKGRGYITPTGESHPRARLTDDQVAHIRVSRERPGLLAARYGISREYVWQLRRGWRRSEAA